MCMGELGCLQALRVKPMLSLFISGPRDGLVGGVTKERGGVAARLFTFQVYQFLGLPSVNSGVIGNTQERSQELFP